jgi:hypothetical protein
MEPRRKTNKKIRSTALPPEYLKNVKDVFTKAFQKRLGKRKIFVEGRLFPSELILCVGYLPDPKGLKQTNFEASIDHSGKDVFEKLGITIDAIAGMMDQYLESGETQELPLEWTQYDFDKTKVFLRTSGRNTELEKEANKILGVDANDALYTEGDELEKMDESLAKDLASDSTSDEDTGVPMSEDLADDPDYQETMRKVDEKLKKKTH